ncbi:hypothetical protein [Streptomyces sp. NPDC003832]
MAAPAEISAGELRVRRAYDGKPAQLSASWEPYDLTAGSLSESGPHSGAGVVNRLAGIEVTVSQAVEQPEPRTPRAHR